MLLLIRLASWKVPVGKFILQTRPVTISALRILIAFLTGLASAAAAVPGGNAFPIQKIDLVEGPMRLIEEHGPIVIKLRFRPHSRCNLGDRCGMSTLWISPAGSAFAAEDSGISHASG
jgi:hypothetical protein